MTVNRQFPVWMRLLFGALAAAVVVVAALVLWCPNARGPDVKLPRDDKTLIGYAVVSNHVVESMTNIRVGKDSWVGVLVRVSRSNSQYLVEMCAPCTFGRPQVETYRKNVKELALNETAAPAESSDVVGYMYVVDETGQDLFTGTLTESNAFNRYRATVAEIDQVFENSYPRSVDEGLSDSLVMHMLKEVGAADKERLGILVDNLLPGTPR